MRVTGDDEGRLIVPPDAREAARIVPGATFDMRVRDGVIQLELESVSYRLVKKGHLTVLEPVVPLPPVTVEMVNEMLDQMRREREGTDLTEP